MFNVIDNESQKLHLQLSLKEEWFNTKIVQKTCKL